FRWAHSSCPFLASSPQLASCRPPSPEKPATDHRARSSPRETTEPANLTPVQRLSGTMRALCHHTPTPNAMANNASESGQRPRHDHEPPVGLVSGGVSSRQRPTGIQSRPSAEGPDAVLSGLYGGCELHSGRFRCGRPVQPRYPFNPIGTLLHVSR